MAGYQIVTDSTTDITAEMIEDCGLVVIPLCFTLEGATHRDVPQGGMPIEGFYEKLRGGAMSTTAQVNAEEFIETFTPILESGRDVLYIAFSSGLSGTCQSAMVAKRQLEEQYPHRRVEVFDSLSASMGEGLLVYLAVQRQRAGLDLDGLLGWLKENVLHLCHWFTVDDLNHLKRGGRVSAATALVGTMLGIKPVLHVDDEGHLIPVSKVRGRKPALDELVRKMEETAIDPASQTVFISHGDCLEDAQYVQRRIQEKLGAQKFYLNFIGPVIGAHSGPGTVALFFLGQRR